MPKKKPVGVVFAENRSPTRTFSPLPVRRTMFQSREWSHAGFAAARPRKTAAPLSVQATLTTRPLERISQTQENTCARGPLRPSGLAPSALGRPDASGAGAFSVDASARRSPVALSAMNSSPQSHPTRTATSPSDSSPFPSASPPPGVVSVFDFNVENPVDTDGDGLNDAEEMLYGTELVDTDGDGFTDPEEVAMGTDPASADTDGDGIPDWDEMDCLAVRETEWLDVPGGTVLMECLDQHDRHDGLATTNLCAPVAIGGRTYDRVIVDLDGRIHLVPTNGVPALDSSSGWNPGPADIAPKADDIIVAGFWDDLVLRPHLGSNVRLAECPLNGCTVIQYENVGLSHVGGTNACLTFQVVIGGDSNFRSASTTTRSSQTNTSAQCRLWA